MKRRPALIFLMLSMFMFQSLWNVAAAFCTHEIRLNTDSHSAKSVKQHFGHHETLHAYHDVSVEIATQINDASHLLNQDAHHHSQKNHENIQDSSAYSENVKSTQLEKQNNQYIEITKQKVSIQDHHDHLPSLMSMAMLQVATQINLHRYAYVQQRPLFAWLNLYQSPDLRIINPPPVSFPRLVG